MNTIKEKVDYLNEAILSGKALEAFDKLYHDDVKMSENGRDWREGKQACRDFEVEFFGNITALHGAEVKNVAVGENVSMIEMFWDYEHKEWGRKTFTQVGVQEWQDGKIIKETFYYG